MQSRAIAHQAPATLLWLRRRWRRCRSSLRSPSLIISRRLLLIHHHDWMWVPCRRNCLCWRVSTIFGQERDAPVVDVLSFSDTLGNLARRRSCEEITDAGKGAVPLLNGVERSLVGAGDVVSANLPDVISKVKGSLHVPQLVLDGP